MVINCKHPHIEFNKVGGQSRCYVCDSRIVLSYNNQSILHTNLNSSIHSYYRPTDRLFGERIIIMNDGQLHAQTYV